MTATTKNTNVLILSAGRRVELLQAFQAALRSYFPASKVYAADASAGLSAACQVADGSFTVPRATAPDYIDCLLALCGKHGIGMLIPTIDTELLPLACNRHRFKEIGVELVIADAELIGACRDKRRTAGVFSSLGIDQPIHYPRDALVFPCFCKPYDGSCSIGAQALLRPEMLRPELLADEKNIFMELIGEEYREYTADAYYSDDGKLRCLVPRERIEVRSGEISKGATRKDFVYRYLVEKMHALEGARGCITIQLFFNPVTQSVKALEINPRFGGGYPLSHAAGADYPQLLIREYFIGEQIPFSDSWENGLLMLRYDAKVIVRENA